MIQSVIQTNVFNSLHPQFIKDMDGEALVALPQKEFEMLLETIEDWEDNMLYEQAKAEDTGERILFTDYLKNRKQRNG
jgi:hypothetical protein